MAQAPSVASPGEEASVLCPFVDICAVATGIGTEPPFSPAFRAII